MINVVRGGLPGVLELAVDVFRDERGFFVERYNEREFTDATGLTVRFVQDNHSRSLRHVIRGLHYQVQRLQAKLVYVTCGEILDVAVDVRRLSPTFGRWTSTSLSAENRCMHWIPEGCAHGFLVLSDVADVLYKTTDYRLPQFERAVAWNDAELAIAWPISSAPLLSVRDTDAPSLKEAELIE